MSLKLNWKQKSYQMHLNLLLLFDTISELAHIAIHSSNRQSPFTIHPSTGHLKYGPRNREAGFLNLEPQLNNTIAFGKLFNLPKRYLTHV